MASDVFFFLGVFLFIFVVWVATGGPDRPISFAGPYITPITDVGQTQQGYGTFNFLGSFSARPSSSQTIKNSIGDVTSQITQLQKQARKEQLFGTPSPYANEVRIQNGNLGATDPKQEYVQLSYASNGTEDIDITGWQIVSVKNGHTATIPKGTELFSLNGSNRLSDIVLHPGDDVIVGTGISPVDGSFAENECSGYMGRQITFSPSLSSSCPSALDDFDRLYTGNDSNSLACKNALKDVPRCVVPSDSGQVPSLCISFINNTLTYNGCVASHQLDQNFWTGRWRVFVGFDEKDVHKRKDLWEPKDDIIKLLDKNGYTVDSYTY